MKKNFYLDSLKTPATHNYNGVAKTTDDLFTLNGIAEESSMMMGEKNTHYTSNIT